MYFEAIMSEWYWFSPNPLTIESGKWWGNKTNSPVLAIHGYQDNANSFDRLMPLLSIPGVLCIDLPGHGYSSDFPRGMVVQYLDFIEWIRYLLKYSLKWDKVSFIAHSFGSSLCFSYASLFSSDVHSMVNIDCSRLMVATNINRTSEELRAIIEATISSELERQTKGYSWKDTIKHTYKVRSLEKMPVSLKNCELLCERSTKKIDENNYSFSLDGRMKAKCDGRFTRSQYLLLAKAISCEVLNISPTRGLISIERSSSDYFEQVDPQEFELHLKELEHSSLRFCNTTVDGSHHVHLEEPEKVAPIINKFFKGL